MIKTNKDILIGLIKTLSDNDCREILYFITDKEYKDRGNANRKYKILSVRRLQ